MRKRPTLGLGVLAVMLTAGCADTIMTPASESDGGRRPMDDAGSGGSGSGASGAVGSPGPRGGSGANGATAEPSDSGGGGSASGNGDAADADAGADDAGTVLRGATCQWQAPPPGGAGGNGEPAPAGWCGLGTCQDGEFIFATVSDEPLPAGQGGDIRLGTYVLTAMIRHSLRDCFAVDTRAAQTLLLRGDEGAIVDDDNRFLHWGGRFDYTTEGNAIAIDMTCSSGAFNAPWGPFGPFETYTATQDRLQLYSAECGYQAEFRRISDQTL